MHMRDRARWSRGTNAPTIGDHQYTGAFLTYPVTWVHNHSDRPVRIAGASVLLYANLLPPARLELDPYFDRWTIHEGADGLALLIGHRDFVRVDNAEVSK